MSVFGKYMDIDLIQIYVHKSKNNVKSMSYFEVGKMHLYSQIIDQAFVGISNWLIFNAVLDFLCNIIQIGAVTL